MPKYKPEDIAIAKAIAAAVGTSRFRPTVHFETRRSSLSQLRYAVEEIDTWSELGENAGPLVIDTIISLGRAYLTGSGLGTLANIASKGLDYLVRYLQEEEK